MAWTVSVLLLSKASARGVLPSCQNKRDNKYCNSNFFECVWETKGWCIPTVQFCLHSLSRGLLCKQFVLFGPCVSVFNTMNVYYSENVKIQILSHFWLGRRWWRRGGCRRRIFWGLRSSPRPCQWKNSNQGLQVSDAAEITRAMLGSWIKGGSAKAKPALIDLLEKADEKTDVDSPVVSLNIFLKIVLKTAQAQVPCSTTSQPLHPTPAPKTKNCLVRLLNLMFSDARMVRCCAVCVIQSGSMYTNCSVLFA